jgi:hypothetical protein
MRVFQQYLRKAEIISGSGARLPSLDHGIVRQAAASQEELTID